MSSDWQNYQEDAARFFRTIGFEANVEVDVAGVRASHEIDVFVRGTIVGIEFMWVVECKSWKSNVTKEKVLALLSVMQDVGADRGFLLSERGFQSGAIQAARSTNVTLTSLRDLREVVDPEMAKSSLAILSWRAERVRGRLWSLHKATDDYFSHFADPMGRVWSLQFAISDAALNRFPCVVEIVPNGANGGRRTVANLEELIQTAHEILSAAEAYAVKFGG